MIHQLDLKELVDHDELIFVISNHWFRFASLFKQIRDVVVDIKYQIASPRDKACMVIQSLWESTSNISVSELQNVQKIYNIVEEEEKVQTISKLTS